jgi:hypothetical protein
VGSTLREKLMKEHADVRNAIIRWTDQYFSEFSEIFRGLGKMTLAVLEFTPFPADIAAEAENPEALGSGQTFHWRDGRNADGPF